MRCPHDWEMEECAFCENRTDVEIVPRNAGRRADPSYAPSRAPEAPKGALVGLSEADLAALRQWVERLKYASQSQVADFHPTEIRELWNLLTRVVR